MKDLAKHFLSDTERQQVVAAVKEAEEHTSGEIVPRAAAPMTLAIG